MNPFLSEAIDAVNSKKSVPQPEGRQVADAYRCGDLDGGDPSVLLHVIAFLLADIREREVRECPAILSIS